jgi:hypothetical protein
MHNLTSPNSYRSLQTVMFVRLREIADVEAFFAS